jgi:tRNA nucleotidyltransferase (CCA-adding enzyme)
MEESLPLINKLTGARLRHEINLILLEPKAPDMLSRLADLGILNAIHPALPWNQVIKQQLSDLDAEDIPEGWELPSHADHLNLHQTLSYLVWLGHLPEDLVRTIVSRLRFKSDLRRLLVGISKLNQVLPSLGTASPSMIVQQLDPAPRLAIYAAYLMTSEENLRDLIRQYLDHWSNVAPYTTGEDLRAMGLRPSPAYGQILKALRDAWLDGNIHTPQEEQALLSRLIEKVA